MENKKPLTFIDKLKNSLIISVVFFGCFVLVHWLFSKELFSDKKVLITRIAVSMMVGLLMGFWSKIELFNKKMKN